MMQRMRWEAALPGGGRLTGTWFGQGTTGVLLAHGKRYDQTSWHAVAEEVASEGVCALTIDFRGYGDSVGPTDPYAYHEDIRVAAADMRARGCSRVWAVGGSMGARAALQAVLAGAPLDALFLLSPAVSEEEGKQWAGSMPALPTWVLASEREAFVAGARALAAHLPAPTAFFLFPGEDHGQGLLAGAHGRRVHALLRGFVADPGPLS